MSVTKICPCCKYPFKAIDFRAKTATFCSKDCERAFRNEMPLEKYLRKKYVNVRKCHDCGKPAINYRCHQCNAEFRRKHGIPLNE